MYRTALAHRDLRLMLTAMLVSMAGSWAYNVALLAVVYERSGSLASVGAATLARFIPIARGHGPGVQGADRGAGRTRRPTGGDRPVRRRAAAGTGARLAADTNEITVSGGKAVIHEGDPADALYVLQSGQVEVETGGRGVAALGAGSWFGEIGLLESVPRTATVRTTEASTMLRIDGDAFLAALTTA